jgi:hypothetical protein
MSSSIKTEPGAAVDREELKRLCDEATAGPWFKGDRTHTVLGPSTNDVISDPDIVCTTDYSDRPLSDDAANVRFIAAARTALPALLAELEAKEAEITRLRNDSENWRQSFQNEVGRNVTIGSKLAAANTRASKFIATLRAAENEIHFPGSNKAEGIDIAALIREVLEEVEG